MISQQPTQLTQGTLLAWGMESSGDLRLAASSRPPLLSPNGTWIALSQTGRELLVLPTTTSQTQLIKQASPVAAWSADSRYLTYALSPSAGRSELHLYGPQSQQTEAPFSSDQDQVGISNLVWSADNGFSRLPAVSSSRES